MAKKDEEAPKKKEKGGKKATSVRSYKNGIEAEKQEMSAYSKKFGSTVRGLQADFKKHAKDMKAAATAMREEGAKKMGDKIKKFYGEIKVATKSMNDEVNKLKGDIKAQIKENKEAVNKIFDGVKLLISEINKKKKGYSDYIKAFWG